MDPTDLETEFDAGLTSLEKRLPQGMMRSRVARNLSFITVYTMGLKITEALASKSGTSASEGVSEFVPRMVAMMLTKQYGDQLNTKAAIDIAIVRTILI